MRHIRAALFAAMVSSCALAAQNAEPPEQSPRQALIEMFMGKGENDFSRHLPDSARAVLLHKGESAETSFLLKVSSAVRGLTEQGEKVETYDSGPNILVTENAHSHERIEIAVEHDSASGEEDEIELSVHPYKSDEPEALPVIPRLIFTLKEEDKIWRVTELTLAAHVPLEDPDYLKSLRKQQDEITEAAAQGRVTMIFQTETAYAANHAGVGYVCKMEDLYPSPEGDANVSSRLAQDESNGYRFSLSGCEAKPATSFRLTASPIDPDSEMKTFCVDESGTLKSAEATDSSSCFTDGRVINTVKTPAADESPAPEPGPTD